MRTSNLPSTGSPPRQKKSSLTPTANSQCINVVLNIVPTVLFTKWNFHVAVWCYYRDSIVIGYLGGVYAMIESLWVLSPVRADHFSAGQKIVSALSAIPAMATSTAKITLDLYPWHSYQLIMIQPSIY